MLFLLVAFGVVLFVGLQHLDVVLTFIGALLAILSPFITGLCVAFILNVPLRFLERKLFRADKRPLGKVARKIKRPVCIVLVFALFLGITAAVVFTIIPELGRTVNLVGQQFPTYIQSVKAWAQQFSDSMPDFVAWVQSLNIDWQSIQASVTGFLQDGAGSVLNSTVSAAFSVVNGFTRFFIGLIFAIYILARKEILASQARRLLYAYLPEVKADKALRIGRLSNRTFSSFLSGQLLEAVILGSMFFLVLSLLRFPYTLLISVLIAVTALIPMVGAFIGCAVGAFLILMVNPVQALWFVILFTVLQQLEGNLIYPHVVGHSVSLPSLWVLFAITVGGSVLGVLGMLVSIPLCSVLYALLREHTKHRLEKMDIPADKLAPPKEEK